MLNCIAVFPVERNVFYREYIDGGYTTIAFFLSYFVIAFPFLGVSATSLGVLLTFAIGLQPSGLAFLQFSYVMFCFMFVGECIGVSFCAVFYHIGFSVNIMSVFISFFCMMAGFISINMALSIESVNYISPLKWGSRIIMNVVFREQKFTCDVKEMTQQPESNNFVCPLATGEQVLELYNMSNTSIEQNVWILIIISLAYFVFAYFTLRIRMRRISH